MVDILQVIECLRKNQKALSSKCHAVVFKREVSTSRKVILFPVCVEFICDVAVQ